MANGDDKVPQLVAPSPGLQAGTRYPWGGGPVTPDTSAEDSARAKAAELHAQYQEHVHKYYPTAESISKLPDTPVDPFGLISPGKMLKYVTAPGTLGGPPTEAEFS